MSDDPTMADILEGYKDLLKRYKALLMRNRERQKELIRSLRQIRTITERTLP